MKSKLLLTGLLVVVLGCGGSTEEQAPADTPAPAEGDGAAVTEQAETLVAAVKYCGSCGQERLELLLGF